jgi:integrase
MLANEAIRLVLQQVPNHDLLTGKRQPIAPAHDRRHAHAPACPKTQAIYLHIVREFARFLGRSPDTATVEDLRRYQLYLIDHGTSAVSLNRAITGLKFFFTVTLDRPELMVRMQSVHVPRILPVVLSPDEVRRLIEAAGNLKHQTALSVAYGAGLRASEVVALKLTDVDSERMGCNQPEFRRAAYLRRSRASRTKDPMSRYQVCVFVSSRRHRSEVGPVAVGCRLRTATA